MNADDLEMARRFVACKGWVWLPGMLAPGRGRVCSVDGETLYFAGTDGRFNGDWEDHQCLPDLSDALTRAGPLEVVRRAWGCHVWTAPYVQWTPDGDVHWFMAEVPVAAYYDAGRARFNGPSELHALLAALEAAPGV